MLDGRREVRWTGLVAALVAGAWLLSLPPAAVDEARPAARGFASAWPEAIRGTVSGSLPDGAEYTPGLFLDAGSSVGQAVTADGASVRLVSVSVGGVRELRRLPAVSAPQYFGFVAGGGGRVAWAESVEDAAGKRTTAMWVGGGDGPARRLVADAGDVKQTDSAHDLTIVDGRLHWTAVGPGEPSSTQLRSVSLGGGDERVESVAGSWSPVGWPWLLDDTDAVGGGRVLLMDRLTGSRREFTAGPADFPACGATWCRAIVLSDGASDGVDLVRVDGTQRRRVAGPDVGFPVTDVAVLDRFELLTSLDPATRAAQGRPLSVYDLTRDQTVSVAADAVSVVSRGGWLWWSSGFENRLSWSAVDLRTLS
ncbi:hypothetical protein [Asanoa iriomotensis]|uniref:Uncharacterized protein n=1 Tax=Asanoa iriomotensis TaxID=234613 RepID=A0ABQ4C183_9ACTN|nr:hypothetical protein [Asanoa iriomotensis]GIF56535.1 hypothetical protein Air01nite_26300 [Asanoa iriomotensis]